MQQTQVNFSQLETIKLAIMKLFFYYWRHYLKKKLKIEKGDTPKTLAQQFYKTEVVEYLEAIEWDRDHPENAESNSIKS